MSTADKLNKLIQTKADIKLALIDKGLNPTDVFSTYADDIRAIETGSGSGGVFDFAAIGYTGNEEPLKSGLAYAKEIYDNYLRGTYKTDYRDDNNLVVFPSIPVLGDMTSYFSGCSSLTILPYLKSSTENIYNMMLTFKDCISLIKVPLIDYSKVTNMYGTFSKCNNLVDVGTIDCSSCTTTKNLFYSCHNLTYNPCINTGNVTDMLYMFYECNKLYNPDLSNFDTSNVVNMNLMFAGTSTYPHSSTKMDISNFNTSKVTTMREMFAFFTLMTELILPDNFGCACTNMDKLFAECRKLERIGTIKSELVTSMGEIFVDCTKLKRIECISSKSLPKMEYSHIFGFADCPNLRYFLCKDIGTLSTVTKVQFTYYKLTNWGVVDEEQPDAKQSVIDSLITYSFDRAAAGYSSCTLYLSANTKALLTEDEIAQITAKGYTIA